MFKPRPKQEEVLQYTHGKMGVSAVPGSGKTTTLSALAAKLVTEGLIDSGQEVLVVTLSNSAVNNFSNRISEFIKEKGFLPRIGYRVRTLHGLAHDIIRERPDLAGLPENFQILDERETEEILRRVVQNWVSAHREFLDDWISLEVDRNDFKIAQDWPRLILETGQAFIRQAKDLQLTPSAIRDLLSELRSPQTLIEMGLEIYSDYQRGLSYRSAVDFDDLIRLALQSLRSDPELLAQLRYRWPYVLEDEAQDSSHLQEDILKMLVGDDGNWVRMGDPNQAIYESFTTANPLFLRKFMQQPGVQARALPNSGRSTRSIINLANFLIDWTREQHPVEALREALALPHILETDLDDEQPNPADNPAGIYISGTEFKAAKRDEDPDEELNSILASVRRWLAANPKGTVAVLAPSNFRGARLSKLLRENGIPTTELLQSTHTTRQIAGILAAVLQCLNEPVEGRCLKSAYRKVQEKELSQPSDQERIDGAVDLLGDCKKLEDYLWPSTGDDWLASLDMQGLEPQILRDIDLFRERIRRWQQAALLPVDQLVLTIAQDLFIQPAELALCHKLALLLARAAQAHPEYGLSEYIRELQLVVDNERKMIGFEAEDNGFNPEQHAGKVVVATMHKAKGLEWDRVYLISVNNYDFPSAQPYDRYRAERWYISDKINLQAETLARLNALYAHDIPGLYLAYGPATEEDRLRYSAERLRLLYVGITRAKKELVITFNKGRLGDCSAALPLTALLSYWQENRDDPTL